MEPRFTSIEHRFSQLRSILSHPFQLAMSAVRMHLTILFQLPLQWPCAQSIHLVGVPVGWMQTAWDLP